MKLLYIAVALLMLPIIAWTQSITLDKTKVIPGEEIQVRFTTAGKAQPSSWIGVIPSNIPHGKESVNDQHDVDYQYINEPEGTLTFRAPLKPGSYDFRMNSPAPEGGIELASATFQVSAVDYKAAIKINKNSFTPGETITVSFTSEILLPQRAWIGMIPSDVPHGTSAQNDQHDVWYQYVEGKKSETLECPAPEKAGSYDFRLHDSDAGGTEIASATFQVSTVKLEGTLKLKRTTFVPGETIELEFTAAAGLSPKAWVGMIPSKIPHGKEDVNDQNDIQYQYLDKKTSGVLKFVAPPENGSYDFRLNSTDQDGVEITSVSFTVGGSLDSKAMARTISETGKLTLFGIQFDFNQATIKPESEPILKEVGTLLKQESALKLKIEGHTDNVGKPAYNLELSKKRAESVRTYLINNFQIEAARLTTDGYGSTRPIAINDTEQGRAQNRRVELVRQ